MWPVSACVCASSSPPSLERQSHGSLLRWGDISKRSRPGLAGAGGRAARLQRSARRPRHGNRDDAHATVRGALAGDDEASPVRVVHQFLQACRKSDVARASALMEASPDPGPVSVGGLEVREGGLLAPLAGSIDVGARRVLPGLLLRRTEVLGALAMPKTGEVEEFLERVKVVACTGEEATLHVTLRRVGRGAWRVSRVSSEPSEGSLPPSLPHTRNAPEEVVQAQLLALRSHDLAWASQFMLFDRAAGPGWALAKQRFEAGFRDPPLSRLVGHSAARLGASALLSERSILIEVVVEGTRERQGALMRSSPVESTASTFIWSLCMDSSACWRVQGIAHRSRGST